MERLARQVAEARGALSATDTAWKKGVDAVKDLANAFESLGRNDSMKDAARQLLSIAPEIGLQINNNRSAAVRDTCKHMTRILVVTGRNFSDVANALMPVVAGTAKASSAAIRQPGAELFARMSELARYDLQLLKNIYMKEKAHERVCILILEQLSIVFVYWTPEEAAPNFSDIAAIFDGGLNSGSELVRRAARDAVAAFSAFWPDRVGELRDIPLQQRILLVYEHPDSGIASALLERHPDLAGKVQKFQMRESKKNPVRPRVNSRRISSIVKKAAVEESSSVRDVKAPRVSMTSGVAGNSVSPDRSSEETLSEEAAEQAQTALADEPVQPVVERLVEDSRVDALPLNTSKPTVGQGELTEVTFQDDSLIPQVPPEFNGSQMYAHAQAQSGTRTPSVVGEDPSQHENPGLQTEPTLLDQGTGRSGVQRSSVRATGESRIPVRVPSRSSSIPVPASRIVPEAPAPRSAIPPIEFSGLSVSNQNTGSADNTEDSRDEKPTVRTSEREPLFDAGFATSVPVGTEKREIDVVTVAERDYSQAIDAPKASASTATGSEHVDNRLSEFALADTVHASPLLPHLGTGRVAADNVEEISQLPLDPVDGETWLTPPSTATSSNFEVERPTEASDVFSNAPPDSGDPGLLYTEFTFDDPAARQTPAADEILEPTIAVEAPLVTSPTDVVADARLQEVVADMTTQELQRSFADVGSAAIAAIAAPTFDDEVKLEHLPTIEAEVPPIGALERLQAIRQQYADLRSISKFDVRDFPVKLPPEVLINGGITTRDDASPIRLDERDFVAVGRGLRTEPTGSEGYDTKTRGRNRQPREPANPSGIERGAAPNDRAKPRIPSREADARRSRGMVGVPPRDHSRDRSCERRAENGERGSNTTAAVSERPLVRKKSIPNLLKGVRLKYEDKPGAQLQLMADYKVPRMHQDQVDYVSDAVPTAATECFNAGLAVLEFAPQVRVDTHSTSSLDEDAPAQASYEPVAIPRPRAAIRATPTDDDDAPAQPPHAPIAASEPPAAMTRTPKDTRSESSRAPSSTLMEVEHTPPPHASPYRLVQEDEQPTRTRRHVPTPTKPRSSWPLSMWNSSTIVWFWVVLGLVFGGSGLLRAMTTIQDTYEYHHALKLRIDRFEVSVAESHETVHKLEENYAVWSEYVRVLAEEDEANAAAHLEMIQQEVEKWQRDMKADLLEFRRSLSTEGVDAVLAPLLLNVTQGASRDGE